MPQTLRTPTREVLPFMKRLTTVAAFAAATLFLTAFAPTWASGSGGGGGGGAATGGGTAIGGSTGVKTCSPSVALTATASVDPLTPRALTVSFVTNCASRAKVTLTATNTRTNALEWSQPDNVLSTFTWFYPQWGTQYRIDGRMTDGATGALLGTASTQVATRNLPASCGPTLSVAPTAGTTTADWNITVGVNAFWCQGPTNIVITGTNTSTGAQEFRQNLAAGASSVVFPRPRANTTYNIVATAYDSLNGTALTSATGSVVIGPYPADCGPSLSLNPTAGTTTADWNITVGVNTLWCFGPANVYVSATNTATGQVEYNTYVNTSGSVVLPRPKGNTTYTISASAYDAYNGAPLATATSSVTTGLLPANCAQIVGQNITTGYWGIYAAIWIQTQARDCGYGGESVHVKVTNMNSGQVEYEVYNMGMSSLLDFEGPIVKKATPYQFDIDVRGIDNEVLDSRSQIVTSSP